MLEWCFNEEEGIGKRNTLKRWNRIASQGTTMGKWISQTTKRKGTLNLSFSQLIYNRAFRESFLAN